MRRTLLDPVGRSLKHSLGCRASCVTPSWRRFLQINATPSTPSSTIDVDALSNDSTTSSADSPDARFEVLGSPYSLLSVSLSASQNLYTRRGTLVGVSGHAENAVSTLSMLSPFRRAVLGIPFLYQRISSTSPLTALISTKSAITSFAVVQLDGTLDWMVTQRQALLAWTGHSISVRPTVNRKMSLAHWGNSQVTGRGLLALVGKGQVYQINVKAGEDYVAHPSNVVAYTVTQHPPQPYRLKSATARFQIPSIGLSKLVPDTKFFRVMRESATWRALTKFLFTLRTWSRRTIWGDRLFLQFHGPATILLQSRASRLNDVLTARDVNEIADAPAGAVQSAVTLSSSSSSSGREAGGHGEEAPKRAGDSPTHLSVASVGRDGKVEFKDADDFKGFV